MATEKSEVPLQPEEASGTKCKFFLGIAGPGEKHPDRQKVDYGCLQPGRKVRKACEQPSILKLRDLVKMSLLSESAERQHVDRVRRTRFDPQHPIRSPSTVRRRNLASLGLRDPLGVVSSRERRV